MYSFFDFDENISQFSTLLLLLLHLIGEKRMKFDGNKFHIIKQHLVKK